MGLVYKPDTSSEGYVSSFVNSGKMKDGSTLMHATRSHPGASSEFNLQYPNNLDTSPEYGKHRVVFFINVSGNGKLAKDYANTGTVSDYRQATVELPENEYYKMSGEKIKEAIRELPGSSSFSVLQPMKRLISAIALYVPNTLSQNYNVSWSEEDLSTGAIIEELASAGLKAYKGQEGGGAQAGGAVMAGVGGKLLNGMSYAQKATRMTMGNSKAEQLFKGVDFKSFSFDYEFAPKSMDEATSVLQIVRMFKHHMLPEYFDKANFMFIYPSEFDIKYFSGDQENEHLEKHMTAVLTGCNINYTPDGQFNTFPNGMPTRIRMQLSFKELGTPTKETSPYDRSGI